ncbi:sodium-extruding oxaloacetate decarboxylase subunit alpha [Methanobrevibacter curvatus]|uniref:2-oxoglutarate carboxylase large subunit n=1 Tax=Methanobrevibacter curvatus TaxID=49547 RepID=A0A165ZIN7_9EURY|nr:sodium-extruding oxaloacetate decarboxylase subunit alpha [Methanobrevibacter curvatus]KZX10788.1 2-oxoglutarate carboxylase large subunit [Methanobrevibacter curvatus]
MTKIRITETALRDAHQSLLATRMRTRDMLPIVEELDKVGYFSIEAWGGATFDTCIRYLNEDPWERLVSIKDLLSKTPLQMLIRGQNLVGYKHYPDDVVEKFVEKSYENGVDIFRVFDALNDVRNMKKTIEVAKAQGAHVQGTISYTISPVHSLDDFLKLAKELEALECDSIAIKDMAGLLYPKDISELVTQLKDETDLIINLHSHCTSGMTPISYYAACEAGVDILDCAISPLSWGTSQPPTESIVAALEGTKYDTKLSLKLLNHIKKYFEKIREKYSGLIDPISEKIDTDVLIYQIPGGMLSNLISQLKAQNALDRYEDVLKEMPKVREDMGYPPLVTPSSQIVGTQAVMNVLNGKRYQTISNEMTEYVKGFYGQPPIPIKKEIVEKIIGDEKQITVRPADLIKPEYEEFKKLGEKEAIIRKEEDILTLALYPAVAKKFLKGDVEEEEIPDPNKIAVEAEDSKIPNEFSVEVDGEAFDVKITPTGLMDISQIQDKIPAVVEGGVISNIQGMVSKILVSSGDKVEVGDTLIIIEAMKMENNINAQVAGKVETMFIDEGDTVNAGDTLMIVK